MSKGYFFAPHDYKMCFIPNCRFHIVLIGNVEDLLQKMDAFWFTYEDVACLYTLHKNQFIDRNDVKKSREDKCFLRCREQFILVKKSNEWRECASLGKKTFEEEVPKVFTVPFAEDKNNAN